jgi:thioredoxin 2
MDAQYLHAVCAHCGSVNRIPQGRLTASAAAKCGKCGEQLFPGEAEPVSAAVFERMVARSDIPLLVDFWAPWCGPCKALAPVVEHVAQMLSPQVKVLKVNVDETQELAQRLGIRAIPTLAIFNQGREIARSSGVMNQKAMIDWAGQSLGLPVAAL